MCCILNSDEQEKRKNQKKEMIMMKEELLDQIREWQRQMNNLEDMIEEAYKRIDQIDQVDAA